VEAAPADSQSESGRPDEAVKHAIEAYGWDLCSTMRALILANEFLEAELKTQGSHGLRGVKHGRFKTYSGSDFK
jgi:hypothetical protein